jgi:diguanylate cyclase (GGDEF)-like protein
LVGITLINFVFGGMFPEFPLLAITLPFLIVSACLLLNINAAVLMLIINMVGFAAFVQPVWGGGVQDLASLGATVLSAVLVMFMVDRFNKLKEKHLAESQKLSKQMEKEYHNAMEELSRTKDALMREHENRKELDKKSSSTVQTADPTNRFNPHTGIMTEETIKNILESEIARTRRYQRPLSLMSIRVDDFEEILQQTDMRGENVLSSLCDLFLEALRREDMLGHSKADGFYVILPETGRYASYVVGERLRHLVEVMNFSGLGDVNLTISVGITAFQDQSKMTPERFFEQANEAVEAAVSHGGNWTISWHDMSHSNR